MSTTRVEDNTSNSGSGRAKSIIVQPAAEQSAYLDQTIRTESFEEYPPPHNVNVLHLAKAGFFYTPRATSLHRVTCIGCSNVVNQWRHGDVPSDSQFHKPSCRFIKDITPGTSGARPLAQPAQESTKPHSVARHGSHASMPALPGSQTTEERVFTYVQSIPTYPASPGRAGGSAHITHHSVVRSVRNAATGNEEQSVHRYESRSNQHETRSNHSSGTDIYSGQRSNHGSSSGGRTTQSTVEPPASYQPVEDHRFESQASTYPQSGYVSRIENSQDLDTFLRGLDMRIAQNRLHSFEELWDDDNEFTNKRLLVVCGFFCIGQGDAVECFHCHVVVANWSRNDNPRIRHEQMSPDCRFLLDGDCGDQPLSVQRAGRATPVLSMQSSYSRQPSLASSQYNTYPTHPPLNLPRDEESVRSYPISRPSTQYMGFPSRGGARNQDRNVSNLTAPTRSGGNSPYREGVSRSSSRNSNPSELSVGTRHSSISPQRGGRHGSHGRGRPPAGSASASYHPHSSSVPPPSSHHSLISQPTEETSRARQGSGQNPHRSHTPRRENPPAPRYPYGPASSVGREEPPPSQSHHSTPRQGHNPPPPPPQSNNPPAPRSEHSQPPRSRPPSNVGGTNYAREYPCLTPYNSDMADAHRREATFRPPFPRISRLNASFREIAEAGFYYTGELDRVRCFYCHGGLAAFEPGDDIWEEHAKFHPHCDFLKRHRGPAWVEGIASRHPNSRPVPIDQLRPVESSGPLPPPPAPITDPVELGRHREEIFHQGMTSEPVRAARDAGYAEDRIRFVQWTNVCNRGACYQSAEALLNALIDDAWYQDHPDHPRHASDEIIQRSPQHEIRDDGIYVDGMPMEQYINSQANQLNLPIYGGGDVARNVPGSNVTMHSMRTTTRRIVRSPAPQSHAADYMDTGPSPQHARAPVPNVPRFEENYASGSRDGIASNQSAANNEITSEPSARRRLEMLEQEKRCKICMNSEANVLFLPCKHICSCQACAERTNQCYVCRAPIQRKINTFHS